VSSFIGRQLRIALALGAVSIPLSPALAEIWDSGGADNNWGTALNWDTNLVPANNGTANISFGTGARLTPNVNVPWDVASLSFNPGAAAFSLGGSILTIRGGGISNGSSISQTIADPITLGAAQSWVAISAPLLLGANVVNGGNLLTVGGASNTSIIAVMSGAGGLTKSGGGTLTLGNGSGDTFANTYTGLTTVSAGTLLLDKAAGTAAIAGDLVANGGTITANRAGQFSSSSNVTISGGSVNFGASNTIGSFTALFGAYSAAGGTLNLTSTATYALTLGNGLGVGGFNFTGASGGGINLPNGSNFGTTLGAIGLGGVNRTINVAEGGVTDDLAINGVVSNGGIIKNGPGTLTLGGANTYAGGTTINQGQIRISADTALGNAASPVTLNGGTLWITGPVSSSRPVVVSAVGGTINSNFDSTWSGVLSGTGPLHKVGQKIVLGSGAADTTPNTFTGVLTVDEGGLQLDKAAGTVAVAGNLIINTDGWVVTNRAGQFGNGINITVNGGELNYGASNSFGSLTFYGGTLDFSAAGVHLASGITPLMLGGGVNLSTNVAFDAPNSGGVTLVGNNSSSSTISGNINLELMDRVFDVANNAPGDDLIVTGQISNGGIIKSGIGTLMLNASNTYSNTTITSGAIRINADNALGAGGVVLNGGKLQTSATFTLSHALTTNVGSIETDPGTTLTFSGGLSGTTIFKWGDGTLLLTGPNTIGGNFVLLQGTTALGSDGALGSSALQFSGGAVRADGTPRTLSNAVLLTDDANAIFDGSLDLTFTGPLTLGSAATLTVNNTTRFNGPVSGFSPAFTKMGTGTLILAGNNPLTGPITVGEGTIELAGGTLNSPVINRDQFRYSGGVLNGLLTNYGSIQFTTSTFTASGGIVNYSTITVPGGKTLNTSGGPGLDNEDTLLLSGGAIGGAGLISNFGLISGNGTIGGTGGFINNGQITPDGVLILGTVSAITNLGQIDIPAASQLRLGTTTLQNSATINLNGGSLINGSLANLAGGTITGHGTINSVLTGASAGNIVVTDGTLNILLGVGNSGAIQLGGLTATLTGGSITNNGVVQGFGTIANQLLNQGSGSVEATGGTLILSGSVVTNAGLMAASTGNKLLITKGLTSNAGTISLTGGTFDNNGNAINNTGQISGYGTFRSGGLTNSGSITLTGGVTTVNGNVTNSSGKKIEVRFSPAIFTGTFTNNGIFKNTSAQVTFSGTYIENGTFLSDPADNFFQNVSIGASGAWSGGPGDRFFISGDLLNNSQALTDWQTSTAELDFFGGHLHHFTTGSTDLGTTTFAGYDNNFAWGKLVLGAGDQLQIDGLAAYIGILDLQGGLAQIPSITASGNVYYDLRQSQNAWLNGQTYDLTGGGTLAPVPEPSCAAILLMAAGICLKRRVPCWRTRKHAPTLPYNINCI